MPNEPKDVANYDQAQMAIKDVAVLHSIYYHKLREYGVPRMAARMATVAAVYAHFSQMFKCKHG